MTYRYAMDLAKIEADNCTCQHFPNQVQPPDCPKCEGLHSLIAELGRLADGEEAAEASARPLMDARLAVANTVNENASELGQLLGALRVRGSVFRRPDGAEEALDEILDALKAWKEETERFLRGVALEEYNHSTDCPQGLGGDGEPCTCGGAA